MKRLPQILMFLAWLLYGAMPAMASFPAAAETGSASAHQDHAGHNMADMAATETAPKSGSTPNEPCLHCGGMKHIPFCAACLVLPPFIDISTLAAPVFPSVRPAIIRALVAGIPAPPERPPRV